MKSKRKKSKTSTLLKHPLPVDSLEKMSKECRHHEIGGRFENPWQPIDSRTLANVIRWKLEKNSYKHLTKGPAPPVYPVDLDGVFKGNLTVTYLGHATILIQMDGTILLTDPTFSDLSIYLKRKIKLPIPRKTLRNLTQVVLISHNHYDHFSMKAVRYLRGKTFIVPLGFERYFRSRKSNNPICLDWFEQIPYKNLKITFLPSQHWSRRTLRDTNLTLWGGFLIEGPSGSVYFSGDSGYFHGFKEIGDRFNVDIALLPIGAFAPRWLMRPVHLSPYEAVKAALDLKATYMIPCHWGTYQISDEPLMLPIQLLERIKNDLSASLQILPLMPGKTFSLLPTSKNSMARFTHTHSLGV